MMSKVTMNASTYQEASEAQIHIYKYVYPTLEGSIKWWKDEPFSLI